MQTVSNTNFTKAAKPAQAVTVPASILSDPERCERHIQIQETILRIAERQIAQLQARAENCREQLVILKAAQGIVTCVNCGTQCKGSDPADCPNEDCAFGNWAGPTLVDSYRALVAEGRL